MQEWSFSAPSAQLFLRIIQEIQFQEEVMTDHLIQEAEDAAMEVAVVADAGEGTEFFCILKGAVIPILIQSSTFVGCAVSFLMYILINVTA